MKITKARLRQIIKEEVEYVVPPISKDVKAAIDDSVLRHKEDFLRDRRLEKQYSARDGEPHELARAYQTRQDFIDAKMSFLRKYFVGLIDPNGKEAKAIIDYINQQLDEKRVTFPS